MFSRLCWNLTPFFKKCKISTYILVLCQAAGDDATKIQVQNFVNRVIKEKAAELSSLAEADDRTLRRFVAHAGRTGGGPPADVPPSKLKKYLLETFANLLTHFLHCRLISGSPEQFLIYRSFAKRNTAFPSRSIGSELSSILGLDPNSF